MHDIAQKQIFFFKLPELDPDPDPDLVVKFPDPDPQHCTQGTFSLTVLENFREMSNRILKSSVLQG